MRIPSTQFRCLLGLTLVAALASAFGVDRLPHRQSTREFSLFSTPGLATPTELPDSLDDAAEIAAKSSASYAESVGSLGRCRVDFDTSAGDETYTLLKSSTEFMQKFVTALCYALVPGLSEQRQNEMMAVAQARAELQSLLQANDDDEEEDANSDDDSVNNESTRSDGNEDRKNELVNILKTGGRDPNKPAWDGPAVRIYFPDEGSAALARRDWKPQGPPDEALVPPCVQFSSCGGVRVDDVSSDMLVFFFCPKASESESVEALLLETEEKAGDKLKLTVFVNPNLVDMGVTGFGMAGRLLRERLIDLLVNTYYLRTLQWGALTRAWPNAFAVWQEDENAEGGYRLIRSLDQLPSNPEVEDIYDVANGLQKEKTSGGPLDQLGDFVNGMMRL